MLFPSTKSILLPLLAGAGTGSALILPELPFTITLTNPLANINNNEIPRLEKYHQLIQKPFFPKLAELFKSPIPLSKSNSKTNSKTPKFNPVTGLYTHHIQPQKERKEDQVGETKKMLYITTSTSAYQTTSDSERIFKAALEIKPTSKKQNMNPRIHPTPPQNHHRLDQCIFHRSENNKIYLSTSTNDNDENNHATDLEADSFLTPTHIPTRQHLALSSILLEKSSEMLHSPSHRRRNMMKTIHLGHAMEDRRLENVFLGLAYTRASDGDGIGEEVLGEMEKAVARDEVEEREMEERERDVMDCLAEAVWALQEPGGMFMDGVWDVPDGRGRLSYLIWRTD